MIREEELKELTNEELVVLIQEAEKDSDCNELQKNLYWEALYEKTKNTIYQTFHKNVNAEHKKDMEDIITILKTGWVKAVFKYDITKDNTKSCFVPFAQHIMCQEYINSFAKRMTKDKMGKSVRETLISNVNVSKALIEENTENAKNGCMNNIIIDKHSNDLYNHIELKDLMDQKLNILKTYYPRSYEMIIENIYKERTQNDIANEYNIKQTSVSRHIKKGKTFLKQIITEDERDSCLYNRKGW